MPTSLTFGALSNQQLSTASNGAQQFNAAISLRDYLSPALVGNNWNAVIEAIAAGDEFVYQFSQDAYNQIFISTSSGKYLDKNTANIGLKRPSNVGIDDVSFRKLAINLNSNKLTYISLLQVLETYYGQNIVRANIGSQNFEPFNLTDGSDLILNLTGTPITVFFHSSDFKNINQATALEVSAVINRFIKLNGLHDFAEPVLSPITGKTIVTIYSGYLGIRGFIQVFGGKAQNILNFPTPLATTQAAGTTWQVDTQVTVPGLGASVVQFTYTGGANPNLPLVHVGDYITAYGGVFSAGNIGSFIITNVTGTTFQIINPIGVAQNPVIQVNASDLNFYRPTKITVNNNPFASFATVTSLNNETDVLLAATTQNVKRQLFEAAYLQGNSSFNFLPKQIVSSGNLTRTGGNLVTVTLNSHGLLTNDKIWLTPGETNFPFGEKTITVTGVNTFTYSETGSNVSSSNNQTLYFNFRDSTGTTYLITSVNNNYSNNQNVFIDGFSNDINTVTGLGMVATATTNTGFQKSTITLLQNGQVLVCGGATGGGASSNTTFLYDPVGNAWSSGPTMNTARSGHTATILNDGRVLIVGGGSATAELYYPSLNIFINAAINSVSRTLHTANLLNTGKVLVVGGGSATAELYDPINNVWTAAATPSYDVQNAQGISLQNGNVLIAGGNNAGTPTGLNTAMLYTPANDSFRNTINNLISTTYSYGGINLLVGTSGKAYIIGGVDNAGNSKNTVQIFEPSTETWSSGPTLNTARSTFGLSKAFNSRIIVYGGLTTNQTTDTNTYETLDFINGSSWSQTVGPVDQYWCNGVLLNNNKVIFAAGLSKLGSPNAELYTSDSSNTISNAGRINKATLITVNTLHQFSFVDNSISFQNVATLNTSHLDNTGNTVNATVTSFTAVKNSTPIGPYIWNTKDGVNITGISTTLNQTVNQGSTYKSLIVNDTTKFPNSGFIVLNFGFKYQTGPIQYFAKGSNVSLLIDSSFVFPFTLNTPVTVILLNGKGARAPSNAVDLGSFYLTDSAAGRIAAESTIQDISAVGINLDFTILYPGTRGLGNEQILTNAFNQSKLNDAVYIWGEIQDILNARNGLV